MSKDFFSSTAACSFQALSYFVGRTDSGIVRCLVGLVLSLNLIHQSLINYSGSELYHNLIFNNPIMLPYTTWSSVSSNWYQLYFISIAFGRGAYGDWYIKFSFFVILYRSNEVYRHCSYWQSLVAVLVAISWAKFKSGFQRTDTILNKLMLLAINTGCITSLCSISSLIAILAAPDTLIYVVFFFSIGRLHAITLLTTLNAREKIRQSDDDTGTKPGRTSPLVFRPLATGKSSIRDGAKVVVPVMRTKHQMNMQRDGLSHMIGGEGDAYELQDLPTGKYDSAIYLHFLLKHSFKIYLE
ncbi:hypothetical protein C8J55DRAFT_491425 [Lentinula edodes]|uniref:DUF6534 domain-containing protein n=1 Tax=Lentinula lateritia TaxID=40482 RepID=A0A9W9A0Q0_9AGAR|nr:hypothetical protein C8J55DRAFT_491425 [Lentinula edodes]